MKLVLTGIALALSLSCTAAFAGDPAAHAGHEGHDKKHMAEMTPAEHQKKMDEKFTAMDTNKDGMLSREEFNKAHEAMRAKHHASEKEGHEHAGEHTEGHK